MNDSQELDALFLIDEVIRDINPSEVLLTNLERETGYRYRVRR